MSFFTNNGIKVSGIACAVPDNRVTVESFADRFEADIPAKFTSVTGIREMYKALPQQTAGDLAAAACRHLFEQTGVDKNDIGLMLLVTQSPDYRRPSSASVLQKLLDLPVDCACMEINLGCSGFIYGLQTAMSMMSASGMKYGLLLMGETASKLVDPMDKSIVMMYGDAGTAVLLEKTEEKSSVTTLLRSDGSRYRSIILPAGGFRDMEASHERFLCADGIERSLYSIYMDGTTVFSFSITDVPRALNDYLSYTETGTQDYDLFVFHQANEFIIKQLIRKLKLNKKDVPVSLDRYGNTGGISIPLTLCDRSREEQRRRARVLMSGFGIGLSWGVTAITVDFGQVYPIIRTADYYKEGRITPQMLSQ